MCGSYLPEPGVVQMVAPWGRLGDPETRKEDEKNMTGDKKNKGRENDKMMGKIVGVERATTESWRPSHDSKSRCLFVS